MWGKLGESLPKVLGIDIWIRVAMSDRRKKIKQEESVEWAVPLVAVHLATSLMLAGQLWDWGQVVVRTVPPFPHLIANSGSTSRAWVVVRREPSLPLAHPAFWVVRSLSRKQPHRMWKASNFRDLMCRGDTASAPRARIGFHVCDFGLKCENDLEFCL